MFVINAENVNDALGLGTHLLLEEGSVENSRNGPVLVAPCPVTTVYFNSPQRVLFLPERDHNPFFAFFETLWMLSGRDDLETLIPFNKRMAEFSDDGSFIRGSAYGKRWRSWFGYDQLNNLVEHLLNDPDSRRAVLTMWDAASDPLIESKDIPCNLQIAFRVNKSGGGRQLDMTVYNRSNDLVWGAYGSNAVHFSMLQEYMASRLGLDVGIYYQTSNNFHAYLENEVYQKVSKYYDQKPPDNPYRYEATLQNHYPMFDPYVPAQDWDTDVRNFWNMGRALNCHHRFFWEVAEPMLKAHIAWRDKNDPERFQKALRFIQDCQANDWRQACEEWLLRRKHRAEKRNHNAS